MNDREIVREAMHVRKFTQELLAKKTGYTSSAAISRILSVSNGMRTDNFIKLLDAMDFEVVVRSKTKSGEEWKVEM